MITARSATPVSEVGLGCWQIGGDQWGDVSDADALDVLRASVAAGRHVPRHRRRVRRRPQRGTHRPVPEGVAARQALHRVEVRPLPATRHARATSTRRRFANTPRTRSSASASSASTSRNSTACRWSNSKRAEVWDTVRALQKEGKIARFGASVESVAEAEECLKQTGLRVAADHLQHLPPDARDRRPARPVPGEGRRDHRAAAAGVRACSRASTRRRARSRPNDHRTINRNGEKFNVGETFAGLGFEKGLETGREAAGRSCPRVTRCRNWRCGGASTTRR